MRECRFEAKAAIQDSFARSAMMSEIYTDIGGNMRTRSVPDMAKRASATQEAGTLREQAKLKKAQAAALCAQVAALDAGVAKLNNTIAQTNTFMRNLAERVQQTDLYYAKQMGEINAATRAFNARMKGLYDSIDSELSIFGSAFNSAAGNKIKDGLPIVNQSPVSISKLPAPSALEKQLKGAIDELTAKAVQKYAPNHIWATCAETINLKKIPGALDTTILRYYGHVNGKDISSVISVKVETGTVQEFNKKYVNTLPNKLLKNLSDASVGLGDPNMPVQIGAPSTAVGLLADSNLKKSYYIAQKIQGKNNDETISIIVEASISKAVANRKGPVNIFDTKNIVIY